ncbi:MAG: ABC transporter substrate-binding protein [Erysipelotrichaceae bacterium]|nr:ABC transporter substrate-binding protein [Erysipelotrichaceae bacterium]
MKKLLTVLLALLVIFTLAGCSGNGNDTPKEDDAPEKFTVGVVQLVQHPALDAATQGFVDVLKAEFGDNIDIDVQNASGESANCATIVTGFVNNSVDLIMANATPALQAASSATGDIPILGTSVTEYGVALGIDNFNGVPGGNVSGTSDLAPLDQQAQMFLDLLPDAKTVGIIYCSNEANSIYQVQVVKSFLEGKGITVVDKSFTDSNDIAMVAEDVCSQVDALFLPTDNAVASCAETIANVVVDKKIPVIAGEEGVCASCGIATLSINYYDLGAETGKMAIRVLKGEANISEMPVQYFPDPVKKYNPELCELLGVEIPEGFVAIEN